jgi:hypothetical protein
MKATGLASTGSDDERAAPVLKQNRSASIHSRGRDRLLSVGVLPAAQFLDGSLAWCPWCPLTSKISFYGVEIGDAGESIEPEESQ